MTGLDLDPSVLAFPADLKPEEIDARVIALAAWSKFFAENKWLSLCLSAAANKRLQQSGYFPAHEPVSKALKAGAVQHFSAGDVIRIINSILDNAMPRAHCCVRDELHHYIASVPGQPWYSHDLLDELTEQALVIGHIERCLHKDERLRALLSFIKVERLQFQAEIEIVEPPNLEGFSGAQLPKAIEDEVIVANSVEQFLTTLSPERTWAAATTASHLKVAILLKCREKLLSTNKYAGLHKIPKFYVGGNFYESLCGRECDGYQKYAAQTLDSCAAAVLSLPTIELKEFRKNNRKTDGAEPLRAHITKGGPAMRLMMWKRPLSKDNAAIEFANVGRKNEEEISYSEPEDAV